jgi:gas vesicle protein
MVRERHNVAFLVGVIFGAAGAATAALFYTPLSGTETRQQLNARLGMLRQQVGARVAALRGDSGPESTGLFGA